MFERYTDRSRRAVVLAQEEARALRHREISTDCLLLGLAAEGEAVAAQALNSLGAGAETLRKVIRERTPPSIAVASAHIPFTRDAKKALELGLRESVMLGVNYVGTEHLLLGLMQACGVIEGTPCDGVLRAVGVAPGDVREAVMLLLKGPGGTQAGRRARVTTGTVGEAAEAIGGLLGTDPECVKHYAMIAETDTGTVIRFCCDDRMAAASLLLRGAQITMAGPGEQS